MNQEARLRSARPRLTAVAVLVCAVTSVVVSAAGGAARSESCDRDLQCSTVKVPLDRAGRVAGTVALHVEVLPAAGTQRGVMFLLAGGPGQGSAQSFDLGSRDEADFYRALFPGYTFVAYDGRGTGSSGPLRCPMVKLEFPDDPDRLAACASLLGARRDFYGTADHAEDLEAVRRALDYRSIAIMGVSYGTQLAVSYALVHPARVERLLLDSVALPDGEDPFLSNLLSHLPGTLTRYCADGSCGAATASFAADVTATANTLAAKPLRARVLQPGGGRKVQRLDGLAFLSLVIDADLNPGLAAVLPAVSHAFRVGNPRPLLRIFELVAGHEAELYGDFNVALYVATICRDGPFPWHGDTPMAERSKLVTAALDALPSGALGPFGRWATRGGTATSCRKWPAPAGGATLGAAPLPDVPVLALSGGFDMRTPTADAATVASRFPRGHLLVVPGVGHSVLSDPTSCVSSAVHAWMAGRAFAARCPRPTPYIAPIAAFAAPDASVPKSSSPGRTLALAARTLREAEATWLLAATLTGERTTVPGLEGGTLVASEDELTLARYSIEPGVNLSGRIVLDEIGPPLTFVGMVTVRGAGASPGNLVLEDGGLRGLLGGKVVGR